VVAEGDTILPILLLLSLFTPFKKDTKAVIDLGVVIMVGLAFTGLILVAYILSTVRMTLLANSGTNMSDNGTSLGTGEMLSVYNSTKNLTVGFDQAVTLIIVAVTIFILALAISALMLLRGRQG